MLGGEVYVGFPFAEQLNRITVFVFAKLINTVNIADFQGLSLVAFLKFWLLLCFVKNLCFPLLYIQKAGNEPSGLHSAAFLLPENGKEV